MTHYCGIIYLVDETAGGTTLLVISLSYASRGDSCRSKAMILIPAILPLDIIAFRADTGEELLVAGGVIGVSVFNPIAIFVGVCFEDINTVRVARLADIATVIIIGISMLAKRRSFYILAIRVKFFALIA